MNRLNLNNMFSLRAGVINQSLVGNIYKPYINYTWQMLPTLSDGEYKTDGVELSKGIILADWGKNDANNTFTQEDGYINLDSPDAAYTYLHVTQSDIDSNNIKSGDLINIELDFDLISGRLQTRTSGNSATTGYNYFTTLGRQQTVSRLIFDSDYNGIRVGHNLAGSEWKLYSCKIQKVTQLPNEAYSKNSGTSKVPLKLYSGNPLDFQGSQYIEVNKDYTDNPTVWSISFNSKNIQNSGYILQGSTIYRVIWVNSLGNLTFFDGGVNHNIMPYQDGSCTLKSNGTNISAYLNGVFVSTITPNNCTLRGVGYIGSSDGLPDGQLDYLVYNKGQLSQEQITKQYTNPNQFYKDMVDDVNTLFATDFRGNDGYISDDVNRSVGGELTTNGDVATNDLTGWTLTVGAPMNVTVQNNSITILPTSENGAQLANYYGGLTVGSHVVCEVIVSNFVSSGRLYYRDDSGYGKRIDVTANGTYRWIDIVGSSDNQRTLAYSDGTTEFTVESMSAKPISAVYPIANYSPTMRTNFTQEPTGLQDLQRSFDSNGFFLDNVDYLNGNGVGYGDTGWIPDASKDFTLEIIIQLVDNNSSDTVMGCSAPERVFISQQSIARLKYAIGSMTSSYTSISSFGDFISLTLVYSASGNVKTYENGILILDISTTLTQPVTTFRLLTEEYFNKKLLNELRLFKVHDKILTQEEVTKAYNKAVAEGLLT